MTQRKFARLKKILLDQRAVLDFLKSLDFTVQEIAQEWRHLIALGEFEGKPAVFKLASTVATSRFTQNEFSWNQAIHLTTQSSRPNFTVPKNITFGSYKKLFYFIAQRFIGQPLGRPRIPLSTTVKQRLPQIAKSTREIQLLSIPDQSAFAIKNHSRKKRSIGQKLLDSASEWSSQVPRNLDTFLHLIDSSKNYLRTCTAHGDFVIRHMFDVDGRIGLIDGEHAGLAGAYHYDVAQFYLRLRVDHDSHFEAKQYLQEFCKFLPQEDQDDFWQELRPPLIQRYIGELWGAAKDESKLTTLDQIGKEILHDQII